MGPNMLDFNTATYFPISIWTVVELNVGVVAACMPAARLFVAKTAGDIAKSTGFTRFSESARPSYDHSGPSSGYANAVQPGLRLLLLPEGEETRFPLPPPARL